MLEINYSRNGAAVSDFDIADYARDIVAEAKRCSALGENFSVEISTAEVIFAVRVLVLYGEISYGDVIVRANGAESRLTNYGNLTEDSVAKALFPTCFSEMILRKQVEMRKEGVPVLCDIK